MPSSISRSKEEIAYVRLLSDTVQHYPKLDYSYNGTWLIGISGGNTSMVLLDMALALFASQGVEVIPFHMYLIPELDITTSLVRHVQRQWGVKLITLPHWRTLHYYVQNEMFSPGGTTWQGDTRWQWAVDLMYTARNQSEIEQLLRDNFDANWVGYGYKSSDSKSRRDDLLSLPFGVNRQRKVFAPLKHWTDSDVIKYMVEHKIPVAETWQGASVTSGNLTLSPCHMAYLHDNWPEDYSRVLNCWPFAITQADKFWHWRKSKGRVTWHKDRNGVKQQARAPVPGKDMLLYGAPLIDEVLD